MRSWEGAYPLPSSWPRLLKVCPIPVQAGDTLSPWTFRVGDGSYSKVQRMGLRLARW